MAESILIQQPETNAIETGISALVPQAESVTITDRDSHAGALVIRRNLTVSRRAVVDLFAAPKKAAHAAHKAVTAAEARLLTPIDAAIEIIDRKDRDYTAEQKRIEDAKRRELEARAREEEERRRLEAAVEAEAAGDPELAEEIMDDAPLVVAPVHVETQVAKVEGVSTRTTWRAEVVDKAALIRYVAERPEWIAMLDANMPVLNSFARSQREALRIPGVRAVPETSRAVRTA